MSDISENQEKAPPQPQPPLNPVIPPGWEPINPVAEIISPVELIEKRGRGRPKGSKNRRRPDGKFASAEPDTTAENTLPFPQDRQFVSEIPGEPNPDGSGGVVTPPPGEAQEPTMEAPAAPPADYKAMALMTVGMSTGILAKIIGPEWEPENEQERDFLVVAVEEYLRVKQTPDIPPGMMLLIAVAGYSAKRIQAPATQSFLSKAKTRVLKFGLWLKGKMRRKTAQVIPQDFSTAPAQ